jgi:hypothetical protein
MANVYAVKSGNWSDTTVWNTSALPTSADDVYSNNFTVTIDQNVTVLTLRNTASSPIVAGGGFLITGTNITVTCTSTFNQTTYGTTTLLTVNSTGVVNINLNYVSSNTFKDSILLSVINTGTVNFTGNVYGGGSSGQINITAACTFNFVGNIRQVSDGSSRVVALVSATGYVLNVTGDVGFATGGQTSACISINGNGNINITGNLIGNGTVNQVAIILNTLATLNVTGNVTGSGVGAGISTTQASYVSVIGSLISLGSPGLFSSNASAINLCSGPFLCSQYGNVPFSVSRIHYIKTIGSYFEFRDSSTNGALSPSPAAPATRLVSPDTVVDSPIPANVRDGVSYALNTLTGTLKVPAAGSVALGVPVDNTTGTAVLTSQAVWDYATSSLTTSGSIGERLKNASTVDTTGDQLAALL